MLKIFYKLSDLDFSQLCTVYGLEENSAAQCNDLYDYLLEDFFRVHGAFYAVWEAEGRYVSVLRAEPYRDGYLIETLETQPSARGKGYAKKLLNGVLSGGTIPTELPVYAHVHKKNRSSLAVHTACGFTRILEHAVFIDGSVYNHTCTMAKRPLH